MHLEPATDKSKITQAIKTYAVNLGFDLVGITHAEPFVQAQEITLKRIRSGLMDGLHWFHPARVIRGCTPDEILPGARSIIAVAMSYLTEDLNTSNDTLRGKVGRYAWGQDYHDVMQRRLVIFIEGLSQLLGRPVKAKAYVDTGPMLDRAVAERAGLGWYGKNTNLLSKSHGSWVFLGQVITDIELEEDQSSKKTCGQCRICIDKCPTGAIVAPYVIDNTKCISYLTIECRGPIPKHLRKQIGDWIFGCDICQDVCPVNRKAKSTYEPAFQPGEHGFNALELLPLLKITEEEFLEKFHNSPIRRAKWVGLLRNTCVALGNIGDPRAVKPLIEALHHNEALVRSHAAWALGQIGDPACKSALRKALLIEPDDSTRDELLEAYDLLSQIQVPQAIS